MAQTKVLREAVTIKVADEWMTLKAVMTTTSGGRKVVYVDDKGVERYSEPLCRSQFKGMDKEEN